jgi:hypothetical protein
MGLRPLIHKTSSRGKGGDTRKIPTKFLRRNSWGGLTCVGLESSVRLQASDDKQGIDPGTIRSNFM